MMAIFRVYQDGATILSDIAIPAFAVRTPISPFNMVFAEKTISGTYYGSVRPDIDFAILADLDMDKKLNLDDLISRTYKFDEINEGFRLLMFGSVARGVIKFDRWADETIAEESKCKSLSPAPTASSALF